MGGLEFQIFELAWSLLAVVTAWHSLKKFGAGWSLCFLIPLYVWGFVLEEAGVLVLNGYYYPKEMYSFYLLDVPFAAALGWMVVIYWSMTLVLKLSNVRNPLKLGLGSAAIGTATDAAVLEPIASFYGFWVWTPPSTHFTAPIGNFIGWLGAITLYVSFFWFFKTKIKKTRNHFLAVLLSLPIQLLLLEGLCLSWIVLIGYV